MPALSGYLLSFKHSFRHFAHSLKDWLVSADITPANTPKTANPASLEVLNPQLLERRL